MGRRFGRSIGASQEIDLMDQMIKIGLSAAISGTVASLVSTAALALLAKAEGRGALQPTNSTSHWLHGRAAARYEHADARHTLVGYGTHHASAVFWALPFETWLANHPARSSADVLRDACVMSAIAAAVDYGAVPKRLTPGWEMVLSKQSMVAAYGSLAIGLALGAIIARSMLDEP
jgi:hypothetical protein